MCEPDLGVTRKLAIPTYSGHRDYSSSTCPHKYLRPMYGFVVLREFPRGVSKERNDVCSGNPAQTKRRTRQPRPSCAGSKKTALLTTVAVSSARFRRTPPWRQYILSVGPPTPQLQDHVLIVCSSKSPSRVAPLPGPLDNSPTTSTGHHHQVARELSKILDWFRVLPARRDVHKFPQRSILRERRLIRRRPAGAVGTSSP